MIALAFSTFHATTFLLVPLLLLYRGGGLGNTLQGLNTAVGLGLFVALWATTHVATRQALRGIDMTGAGPIDGDALVARAFRWGGVNGVMFLLVLGAAIFGGSVAARPESAFQGVVFLIAALVPGSAVAFAIGAVVGVAFAGIDLVLMGIARRSVRSVISG